MVKPLNWMLSDTPARSAASRLFRSRLAATTILAVVPFLGYGRQAYAVCNTSDTVWECHGTENGIANNFGDPGAGVVTDGSLTVKTDGVQIDGTGYVQFHDENAATITNEHGNGLDVRAANGEDFGRIVITTNGTITGNAGGENDGNGIYSRNDGVGSTTIEITGNAVITGTKDYEHRYYFADGIHAIDGGEGLDITTGVNTLVRGTDNGIDAVNNGWRDLKITADGYVSGYGYDGIYARNQGANLTITTGEKSVIRGGGHGIDAINNGWGELNIEANGWVAGYSTFKDGYGNANPGDGIHAENSFDSSGLTITTGPKSTVTGFGDDGIDATQHGAGDLTINVYGKVTGRGEADVDNEVYRNYAFGIETHQDGEYWEDSTRIRVYGGGVVEGKTAGIGAYTDNRFVGIYNYGGTVRNLSGKSYDLAIVTNTFEDGATYVDNEGNLIGTVDFRSEGGTDTVDNYGFWNMSGGLSNFGGNWYGEDTINNYNVLVAADDSGNLETTQIIGLEQFYNRGGVVSLVDGQAGDTFILGGWHGPDYYYTNYSGEDGHLAVDAVLGPAPNGLSDQFIIHGLVDGTTFVHVNVVSANGPNTEGIPVVLVDDWTSDQNFKLDGPLSGGFFTWDLKLNTSTYSWDLYTVTANGDPNGAPVLGAGAFEFPAGFAATQDIWWQTIGTAMHRMADLRPLLKGEAVTPVADFSEPVQATPISSAIMAPGFWFKGFGSYVERNDERNGFDLDQKQTMYGGMAGFDFGTREAFANAWLFGVFGGYMGSDLDFKATNTKWKYEGPTVGAYATYLDNAFYVDATVKADFLNIKINPDKLASDVDDSHTNAVNVGGRLDTGYKFGETAFLEPQASLAVVNTNVDDVNMYGGKVKFDDDTSVRGRLGLRLGVDYTQPDATVYSADVTGSVWETFTGGDSDVTVTGSGFPDFGVSGSKQSTYGDVSVGLGAANPDGWSSFVRGNYVFADDYEAWTGNAGVRFVW